MLYPAELLGHSRSKEHLHYTSKKCNIQVFLFNLAIFCDKMKVDKVRRINMAKNGKKDPHMKSPIWTYLLIILIVGVIVYFVAPKVVEIYNDNLHDTEERAKNS